MRKLRSALAGQLDIVCKSKERHRYFDSLSEAEIKNLKYSILMNCDYNQSTQYLRFYFIAVKVISHET